MSSNTSSVVDRWEESAQAYHNYAQHHTQYDELNEELARFADLSDGSIVFDIGCGTGKTTEYLQAEANVDVLGVDPSRAMLNIYEDRFPGNTVYQCQGENAPFEKEDPDCVVASASIWYMNISEFLHAASTTRPVLYFSINQTFLTFADQPGHRSTYVKELTEILDQRGYDTPSLRRYEEGELHGLIKNAGWKVTRRQRARLTPADTEDSSDFFSIPAVAPFFDPVPTREQEAIRREAAEQAEPRGTNQWMIYELKTDGKDHAA